MQIKHLKIGLIIPKCTAGGAEQVVLELAREYRKIGHDVVVVAMANGGSILNRFKESDINVIELGIERRFRLSLQWLCETIRDRKKIKRLLREKKFDVIHIHLMGPDIDFFYPARAVKIPVIVYTFHNVYTQFANKKFLERIRNWRRRKAYQKYDQLYAVSDNVRDWAIQHKMSNPDHITTIANGIDFSRLSITHSKEDLRKNFGWENKETIILNVGSLTKQKNQLILLQAMTILSGKGLAFRLVIAGEGALRGPLEQAIISLGLKGKVELLGVREDIPSLLKASDVFAFPSLWEGLPIALLEALASGIEVIASDILVHRNILENGKYGWLTPFTGPHDVANTILSALNDRETSQKKARGGHKMVMENFSSKLMAENYLNSYFQILEKKGVRFGA